MEDWKWLFDGIVTEIIMLIVGIIIGVGGDRIYNKHKSTQKAGDNSSLIMAGHDVGSVNIHQNDELSIQNFSKYSNRQIEEVIRKGNNTTIRTWGLELIINNREKYLIERCIVRMDNDAEKYKLLEELAGRGFEDIEYFQNITISFTNDLYKSKAIKLLISKNKKEYINSIFISINNNKYKYESLVAIFDYNKNLFGSLYAEGNCFDNVTYKTKMKSWLEQEAQDEYKRFIGLTN